MGGQTPKSGEQRPSVPALFAAAWTARFAALGMFLSRCQNLPQDEETQRLVVHANWSLQQLALSELSLRRAAAHVLLSGEVDG